MNNKVPQTPDGRPAPDWHLGYTQYNPQRDAELNKAAARTHYERLAQQAATGRTHRRAGVAVVRAITAVLLVALILTLAFVRVTPW